MTFLGLECSCDNFHRLSEAKKKNEKCLISDITTREDGRDKLKTKT